MSRTTWLAATAAFGALASGAAQAQQMQLEEIVVTARKSEERLIDVPLSISVFTAEDIEDRGVRDIFQISQFTPGFSYERSNRYGVQGGGIRPVIRGQSNILGEGNASVFVDGLLFTDNILSFPFDIVERVEVIKGPQAALFGRATFSGAINFITKKGTNEFENRVSVRAAEYSDYEVNLLSRGPIVEDKVFYMVHGRWYDFNGQYRNTLDGRKVGQEESHGVNGSVEFRPSDSLTVTIAGGQNYDNDGHPPNVLQDRFANNCFLDKPRQYYCGKLQRMDAVQLDLAGLKGRIGLDRESTRLTGQVTYEFGQGFQLVSNSAYFRTHTQYGVDSTSQGATAFGLLIPGTTTARAATDPVRIRSTLRNEVNTRKEYSQELRLQSSVDEPIRYLVGAFYYQRRKPLVEQHPDASAPTIDFGTDRVNNWAGFASLEGDFADNWTARAEIRYAQDKIGNFKKTTTVGGVTFNNVLLERKFKSWSPRFTLDYKIGEDSKIYATVAKGNKPGAINADPRFPPDIQFVGEEKSWAYELGAKAAMMDGRLTMSVAGYYTDWSDQQLTTTYFFPTGGTQSYLINAGQSEVKGLEFELNGLVSEYFTTGFTAGLSEAKFTSFNDAEANELFGNPSVKGFYLPNTPKYQWAVFGRGQVPLTDAIRAFARADLSYTDRKYDQIYNLAYNGDLYMLNLKAGLEADAWEVTFFVDNVTDARVPTTSIRFVDQLNLNVAGAPQRTPSQVNVAGSTTTERGFAYTLPDKRRFGVTARYRF